VATLMERAIVAWLHAVAPAGWTDTVIGDLREELAEGAGWQRRRALAQTACIAGRFTLEALASRIRRSPGRTGARNMDILTDLRQAARALARTPGFSLVAIVTLALAIGANTAIYSALSSIVLQPLPFKDGNRFVFLWRLNAGMGGVMLTPTPAVVDRWREATHIFEAVESYTGKSFVMTGSGEPEDVTLTFMNPSTLRTFGVQPVLGRLLVEADSEPSADPVVLISHALWRSRFGADAGIAGKTLSLSGSAYTIIGVMPARFMVPLGSDVMWAAARRGVDDRVEHGVSAVAKLAPGISVEEAQTALSALPASAAGEDDAGWSGRIMTPADYNGTSVKSALFVLSGAVGLLLLIACVNVANLILTRYGARRREVALRHALGATRGRLVRHLLAESALLAVAGGATGLSIAYAGLSAMSALRPRNLDMLERLALDPAALMFAAAATLVTALLFGLAPAITGSRADLQEVLKTGGRAATASGRRVRGALTIAQVALALILLIGAGLLLRSYGRLMAVDPGFDPAGVVSVRVSLPSSRYPAKDPAKRRTFFDQALASIAALPGVTSTAVGMGVPLDSGIMFGTIEIDERRDGGKRSIFVGGHITPDYFSTLSIKLIEGRSFTGDDREGDPVAIVGRSFAKESWPDGSPLGKRLRIDTHAPWLTVVGVAEDVKALSLSSKSGDHPQIYLPRGQTSAGHGAIIVRSSGDPMAVVPALKAKIWALDAELPLGEIATAEQLIARSSSQSRFNLALLTVFAVCGLVLALVGVYGVTALFVGQRQREVGIRMALGATRSAVAALVLRQTGVLLASAVVAGAIGAWLLSRYLESLVFATATTDVATFAVASTAIVIASIAATLVPLRRATSVDPAIVLRAE